MRHPLIARAAHRLGLTDPDVIVPDSRIGVLAMGHRDFVGGLWDEIGRLQFEFMLEQGLTPAHVLLDVGCGALRGGVHFVPYLERGHYLGLDRERTLIRAGKRELGRKLLREKRPELVVSDRFAFERFARRPTIALAQSLFTHLNEADIRVCLAKLRRVLGGSFYATFFTDTPTGGGGGSHSHRMFAYRPARLAEIGTAEGWAPVYIGEFGHPRGQVMMRFKPQT